MLSGCGPCGLPSHVAASQSSTRVPPHSPALTWGSIHGRSAGGSHPAVPLDPWHPTTLPKMDLDGACATSSQWPPMSSCKVGTTFSGPCEVCMLTIFQLAARCETTPRRLLSTLAIASCPGSVVLHHDVVLEWVLVTRVCHHSPLCCRASRTNICGCVGKYIVWVVLCCFTWGHSSVPHTRCLPRSDSGAHLPRENRILTSLVMLGQDVHMLHCLDPRVHPRFHCDLWPLCVLHASREPALSQLTHATCP